MQYIQTVPLAIWATAVAYFDICYRRIPNILSLGACAVGLVVLGLRGASLTGAAPSSTAWAFLLGVALTLPAYITKRLGAGDVKYFAAIALLTSFQVTLTSFIVTGLVGGLLAAIWLWLPGILLGSIGDRPLPGRTYLVAWAQIPLQSRRMAYGALMTIGLFSGLWMEQQS
ncbi:MAG: prepilin peptidase [Aquabacterium sp.]